MNERLWGFVSGLLIGAGVGGHALRLVVLGMDDFTARHMVAGSAIILYGLAGGLTFFKKRLGLWIAIIGPMFGMISVLIAPNAHIDTFQFVLGIPQLLAVFLSAYILYKDRTEAVA